MDYIGYECPVCGKPFHAYEDIVVCPECGTPHHRECYNKEGHCHFEDKHGENDGFDFNSTNKNNTTGEEDSIKCRFCGSGNKKDALFCAHCGNPLYTQGPAQGQRTDQIPFNPFMGQAGPVQSPIQFPTDLDPDEELESGVTAGDVEKYVRTSVPYYMRVFGNIKRYSKSRFNFSAFLFSGGFLLYRKQYKFGAIITIIMAFILIFNSFVVTSPEYDSAVRDLLEHANMYATASYTDLGGIYYAAEYLTQEQLIAFCIPPILQLIETAIMFYVGFTANKRYYRFCIKEISKIKASSGNQSEIRDNIEKKGGVNKALGISIFVVYVIITYLPTFFM